jgi:hypothetical protein
MFKTSTFAYWCCQLVGWGLVGLIFKLNSLFSSSPNLKATTVTCVAGFLATHLLRTFLRSYVRRTLPFPKEGVRLLLAIFVTTGLATAFKCLGLYFFSEYDFLHLTSEKVFMVIPVDYLIVIVPWTLIYWFYRTAVRTTAQNLERRRLEWRLKEMQTRAGESGITMDGLMEEIGRILTLIDENPTRARNEITAFSRLLREGYLDQAGSSS